MAVRLQRMMKSREAKRENLDEKYKDNHFAKQKQRIPKKKRGNYFSNFLIFI